MSLDELKILIENYQDPKQLNEIYEATKQNSKLRPQDKAFIYEAIYHRKLELSRKYGLR